MCFSQINKYQSLASEVDASVSIAMFMSSGTEGVRGMLVRGSICVLLLAVL